MKVLLLWIVLLAIYIALGLACALWVGRRRRTGPNDRASAGWAAADPFFYPIGDCPTVPRERQLLAGNFSAWGIPKTSLKPSAAVAHRRNEGGGRPASPSGTAVVLYFPERGDI
jgi:hypothetical protein